MWTTAGGGRLTDAMAKNVASAATCGSFWRHPSSCCPRAGATDGPSATRSTAPLRRGCRQPRYGRVMLDRIVVINEDTEERGGAAAVALTSVHLLRRRGIPVTVLSSDGGSETLVQLGAQTVALGGRHIMSGNRVAAALRGLYDAGTGGAVSGL